MATKNSVQKSLCSQLGDKYQIREFDLERVIYRDFNNGFDVEISGTHTASLKKMATVYLWFANGGQRFLIAKAVRNVSRDKIHEVAESLLQYSQKIIDAGQNNRPGILKLAQASQWCSEEECLEGLELPL